MFTSMARVAAGAALCVVATGAVAAPAYAESDSTAKAGSDLMKVDAVPPPCVSADVDDPGYVWQTVTVHNGCAATERVKVIGKFAPDSACMVLSKGESQDFDLAVPAPKVDAFDGLQAC